MVYFLEKYIDKEEERDEVVVGWGEFKSRGL